MDYAFVEGFKFLELVLTLSCLSLQQYQQDGEHNFLEELVFTVAFAGFIIILLGEIIGIFTEESLDPVLDVLFSVIGVILYVSAGAILLNFYTKDKHTIWRDRGIAKGSLSIINAFVMCIDIFIVSYKGFD